MRKHILLTCIFITLSSVITAQDYQWAFTSAKPSISNVVGIRKDHSNNFYLSSQHDSSSFRIYSDLEKRDASQQLLWNKKISGEVTITDLEINSANNVVVIGYYKDSLTIDGTSIVNSGFDNSGFIFEMDETGNLQWLHQINPTSEEFRPIELYIAQNGFMYITTEMSGITNNFTSFHKLDSQGNIIKSKFNNDIEVRTYTNILADNDGNVYLSGTCGNFATFDTIDANINYSYQNFVIKYDSSFTAQWFHSREYITFDHNNSLQTDGQSLYWAFVDFSQTADTVKIVNIENNGTYVSDFSGPIPQAFFPSILYSMDSTGHSVLCFEVFTQLFLYRYDQLFNLEWQDTIMSGASGFTSTSDLICYDSTFYLTARYYTDTLQIGNFTLINPNQGANSPSDNFVTKWTAGTSTSIGKVENNDAGISIYPNPATSSINIDLENASHGHLKIFDLAGRLVKEMKITTAQTQINLSKENFVKGIYIFNYSDESRNLNKRVVLE